MRRREFIAGFGSAAAMPVVARAQQPERARKVAALMVGAQTDPDAQARVAAFQEGLEKQGWAVGRNLQINYRWAASESAGMVQTVAAELLRLTPDLVLTNASSAVAALQRETRAVPIVFVYISEPVAQGFVLSLAHPGGNTTGFTNLEPTIGMKWLELLKQLAPTVTRIAVMFNPGEPGSALFFGPVQTGAQNFGVEVVVAPVNSPAEIEAAMMMLGREPGAGLILPPNPFTQTHRKQIIELAARYRLPAIYNRRFFADEGGLVSYGNYSVDQYRQAAVYVDRILRGEKPADLPVQQPTKFEFVINLKTAKALGITIPETLLATADEVIQ